MKYQIYPNVTKFIRTGISFGPFGLVIFLLEQIKLGNSESDRNSHGAYGTEGAERFNLVLLVYFSNMNSTGTHFFLRLVDHPSQLT